MMSANGDDDRPRPPLAEAISRAVLDGDEPQSRFGPYGRTSPPGRFAEVPESVRDWLQQLRSDDVAHLGEALKFYSGLPDEIRDWLKRMRPEDVAEIKGAIEFARSARIIGRFGKIAIGTAVSVFITFVMAGEKIGIAWKWFTGAPR